MSTDRLSMRHTEESRRAVDALREHLFREGLILTDSEVVRWALVVMARRVEKEVPDADPPK